MRSCNLALVSPFTFYRGAAAVMAADLAATPVSGIVVQACGDAHISNFGGFAAPDRRLGFGPNFDETLPGPWEWDVKRMAASVEIAGRDVGLPAGRWRRLVMASVREYRQGMSGFANESHLDVWYDRLNASDLVDRFGGTLGAKGRILFAEPFAKATRKTSLRAVKKLTERGDGGSQMQAYSAAQPEGLAYLSINVYKTGFVTVQLFFGTWLFPLGYLTQLRSDSAGPAGR